MGKEQSLGLLFPGQNSAEPGMGKDLHDTYPEARVLFERADRILPFSVREICFDGTEDDFGSSAVAQSAIVTVSAAYLEVLKRTHKEILRARVAGHSAGEYSAFIATGVFDFETGLKLVHMRGQLMDERAKTNPASMAAILGLLLPPVEEVCSQSGAEVANINSDKQIVIAGTGQAMARAGEIIRDLRVRIVDLKINAGSHCSWAEPIAKKIAEVLENVQIEAPKIPLIANATADYITTASQAKNALVRQLTSRVLWLDTVLRMIQGGTTMFYEVGPQDTLTKLILRIARDRSFANIKALSSQEVLSQSPDDKR